MTGKKEKLTIHSNITIPSDLKSRNEGHFAVGIFKTAQLVFNLCSSGLRELSFYFPDSVQVKSSPSDIYNLIEVSYLAH